MKLPLFLERALVQIQVKRLLSGGGKNKKEKGNTAGSKMKNAFGLIGLPEPTGMATAQQYVLSLQDSIKELQ